MNRTQKPNVRKQDPAVQSREPETREEKPPVALRDMNLTDDFMFNAVTEDLEVCRAIIELSLNRKLRSIRWREQQKERRNLPGKRSIRMDFYAEDTEGNLFDVEMQNRKVGDLPKRTRFYQALLDAPLLKRGEESFEHLNPLFIIVICNFDPFGLGKYRYSFCNQCREVPGLVMGDECQKIFLNTKGENDDEVERPLLEFLKYASESDGSRLAEDCDGRVRRLHEAVERVRASEEMEVSFMKMETRDRLIREEGRQMGLAEGRQSGLAEGRKSGLAEGLAEGRKSGLAEGSRKQLLKQVCLKLRRGDPAEKIAEDLCEDPELIRKLCEAARECGPAYDPDEAYEKAEAGGVWEAL